MKHDVAILLALVAVLVAGAALVLASADFRARRVDREHLEELRARRPYFGWEEDAKPRRPFCITGGCGSLSLPMGGTAWIGTAW